MINRFLCRKSTTTAELEGHHFTRVCLNYSPHAAFVPLMLGRNRNKNRALKAKKAYSTP